MSKDVRLLLVAAVGLGFFVWGMAYAPQFGQLVTSTTTGYGNVVKALQPGGIQGGAVSPTSFASEPIGASGISPGMMA